MSPRMDGPSGEEKPEDHIISTAANYSFRNHSNLRTHLLQSLEPTPYQTCNNFTSSMEMMVGFPQQTTMKNIQEAENSSTWKDLFFNKPGISLYPSSSKAINGPTSSSDDDHNQFYHPKHNDAMMVSWNNNNSHHHHDGHSRPSSRVLLDDPSSSRCVFPCEANERPSRGLSLSLSSSNPSSIGLQSFELRPQNDHDLRVGPSSSRSVNVPNHLPPELLQVQYQIRNSTYLGPARELLNEICSLGTKQSDDDKLKVVQKNSSECEEDEISAKKTALCSLDLTELQRRKIKLLQMVAEVDRRYKHYCNQTKAAVSSFEAMAGYGSTSVYTASASKAMWRHFRCLRDGIVRQIKATKKAMGDKDSVSPGTVRGETPRLRILDQTLRQQKALEQMNLMESHPWRPQRGLPERSVSVLRDWLFEHFLHPYPNDVDKHILSRQTGLSRSQVSNWFINARVRLWKPMVEEMYLQEVKEQQTSNNNIGSSSSNNNNNLDTTGKNSRTEDRKPTHDRLVRIDPGCLSSIISSDHDKDKRIEKISSCSTTVLDHHHHHNSSEPYIIFGDRQNAYGGSSMVLDFSSHGGGGGWARRFSGGGGGVSLTLELHRQNVAAMSSGGVGLAVSSSSAAQSSLCYSTREDDGDDHHQHHIEDCENVAYYSLLDGEQGQALQYRDLIGAQLLHDLAG